MKTAQRPRGYWAASTLGMPVLNAALGLGVAWARDSIAVGCAVAGALVLLELVALGKWLRLDGVESRAWRLFLVAITLAVDTVAAGYVLFFALFFIACSSGGCGD